MVLHPLYIYIFKINDWGTFQHLQVVKKVQFSSAPPVSLLTCCFHQDRPRCEGASTMAAALLSFLFFSCLFFNPEAFNAVHVVAVSISNSHQNLEHTQTDQNSRISH